MTCRSTEIARILCTLLFPDGTWTTQSVSARTATLRLTKHGRTYATGKQVLRAGKLTVKLRSRRTIRAGTYRLVLTVGKTTRAVDVTVRKTPKIRV